MEQDLHKYRTVSGLEDGEKVISEWTLAKPKNVGKANATTGTEQATKEIVNKYTKQKKTGYFENKSDIDNIAYVEPMLAKNYKDYKHKIDLTTGEYILQCKYNGMRCIATKDGLFTRKGEKYLTCPHIEKALAPFFEEYPDAVLDGELFNEDLRQQLNEISKLVRRTVHITDEHYKQAEEMVRYYVYDGYGFGIDKNCCYTERKNFIDIYVVPYYYVVEVPSFDINSEDDLNDYYLQLVDQGHEGAMLRLKNMGYENKRSKNLLKIKPEDSDDAIILDITEGEGNWAGTGKRITLDWNGLEFDATFKGTYEQAVQFLLDKNKWIGKKVEFLYNGLTGLGTPNFARVDINNCLKDDR
jgi:ATP-dependent DNA ligase